jgi:type 1 fimbriae regulatory protein FimB
MSGRTVRKADAAIAHSKSQLPGRWWTPYRFASQKLEAAEPFVKRAKGSASGSRPFFNGESQAIRAWPAERSKMNVPQEVDTLFVSEQRRPLNRASVWHMIKAVAREAGLSDVHPDTLRHSTGYNLVNRGTDLRLIQSFMGHKSINSTIRYTAVDTKRYAKLF